jgi:hypothetical protein
VFTLGFLSNFSRFVFSVFCIAIKRHDRYLKRRKKKEKGEMKRINQIGPQLREHWINMAKQWQNNGFEEFASALTLVIK